MTETRMTRLAAWSQRHHWTAIVLWVVTLVGISVASSAVGSDYKNDFTLPGTESQALLDTYAEHAPDREGDAITVVVQADAGIDQVADEVEALVADLEPLDHVAAVQPPDPQGGTVSPTGSSAWSRSCSTTRPASSPPRPRRRSSTPPRRTSPTRSGSSCPATPCARSRRARPAARPRARACSPRW